MDLVEYPDREALMIGLAGRIAGALGEVLRGGGRARIAVPGGTTPGPFFDFLSAAEIGWERVDVLPTDERLVPADDTRSNARLIRARLLRGPAAAARFVPLGDAGAPDGGLAAARAAVAALLPLDIAVLGMGADGHVASLFAGAPGLDAALAEDAPPVARIAPPDQPEARLSLTLPVLRGAGAVHVLIAGTAKRAALERVTEAGSAASLAALLGHAQIHYAE